MNLASPSAPATHGSRPHCTTDPGGAERVFPKNDSRWSSHPPITMWGSVGGPTRGRGWYSHSWLRAGMARMAWHLVPASCRHRHRSADLEVGTDRILRSRAHLRTRVGFDPKSQEICRTFALSTSFPLTRPAARRTNLPQRPGRARRVLQRMSTAGKTGKRVCPCPRPCPPAGAGSPIPVDRITLPADPRTRI